MNNVITILVDSVFSECIGSGRTEESSTPFIDSLLKDGILATNVYSYGPYTDAATKGLYCGNKTLDDYGYFFGINSSMYNHFRTFHDNGYETYGFYYPCYLVGTAHRKYIDHVIFTGSFDFPAVWFGRYSYYSEKIQKYGRLSDLEYKLLVRYTDIMFECWLDFYRKMDENEEARLILGKGSYSCDYFALNNEFQEYCKDKVKYLNSLLNSNKKSRLYNIDSCKYNSLEDYEWLKENVYKKNKCFFRKLDRKQLLTNLINNKFSVKQMLTHKRYLINSILCLFTPMYLRMVSKRENWKPVASFSKKLEALSFILKNRDMKRPFYVSLHTEDAHNYVTFFSYDVQNLDLLKDEFDYLKPLLNGLGENFKGSIVYQLSLRYIDLCVKRLVDMLDKCGVKDNTTIVLMADHGSSYTFNPIRNSVVNNFYKENYKTPLMIYNPVKRMFNGNLYNGLYSACDVQKTICDLLNLQSPPAYTGQSIVQNPDGRNYIVTEYMGPGCPDMITRDVWMMVRDNSYSVAFKNNISNEFDANKPVELYDLKMDPLEKCDLSNNKYVREKSYVVNLVRHAERRFTEICSMTKVFLSEVKRDKL